MNLQSLLYVVFELAIIGIIFWLLTWALGQLPIPEPIRTVIRVVLIVVLVLICIYFLIGLLPSGGGTSLFPRRP